MANAVDMPVSNPPATLGKHTQAYMLDKNKKDQQLAVLRGERATRPAWNTVKTVATTSLASVSQITQLIGSIFGHVVFALPAALVGSVVGFAIYAPAMKVIDHVSGSENRKSFFEYTITPANVLSNLVYNRVTDFLCRYVVGFGLMLAVVEPLFVIAGVAVGGVIASPFIYNDFKNNHAKNVERFIDAPVNFSIKWNSYRLWQKFDDLAAGKSQAVSNNNDLLHKLQTEVEPELILTN